MNGAAGRLSQLGIADDRFSGDDVELFSTWK